MSKLAFIGLGTMGFPMAGHLKTRGHHELVVFNRTRAKAEAFLARFGGTAAATPAEAVAFLNRFFARHKGKYELSVAEAAEPVETTRV